MEAAPKELGAFRRQLCWFFGISLVLHLITAIYSVGFFSWDEHFQTFEFLSPRLGRGSVSALPWEYAQQARQWFQPAIFYGVISGLRALGVQNAAVWSEVIRALSGLASWTALLLLSICSLKWLRNDGTRRAAIAMAGLLCFFPFLDVRTSSENWSAAAFFIGLALYFLIDKPTRRAWVAGLLMGLSIQFRYQNAFMVLGFLAYLFCDKKRRDLGVVVAMIAVLAIAGVGIDSWGYGHFVFVPWNYFKINLIEGKASWFSRDPIWFYFGKYSELAPPIGGLCFLGAILGWIRKPRHVLTWVTLPAFVISCLIAHKEARFLFPLVPAAPFLIALGLESFSEARLRHAWKTFRWVLIPANSVLLAVFCFKPAYSPFQLYGFIGGHPEIKRVVYRDENPFVQIRALQTSFYKPPTLALEQVPTYTGLNAELLRDGQFWLFEGNSTLPPEAGALREHCRLRFSAFPMWLNALSSTPLAPVLQIPGIKLANRRSLFFCSK